MKNSKSIDLTNGSIIKQLIKVAIPLTMANLLQMAYQLVDTFWLGRVSSTSVAAVSMSFPIMFLSFAIGIGLPMAGSIFIAQFRGRKDWEKVDFFAAQSIVITVSVALIVTFLGLWLSPVILSKMGAKDLLFNESLSYLKISFYGVIFVFTYIAFQFLMKGVGDVKTPLYIVLGTVTLNCILDPIMIIGYFGCPKLGIRGAAWATVISQSLGAIIGMGYLLSGKLSIHIKFKNLKPDFTTIFKMIKMGIPAILDYSVRAFGVMIMMYIVTSFGDECVAAFGIGSRVMSIIIMPGLALAMATSTFIGQNLGADNKIRAKKCANISLIMAFLSFTLIGILVFIFANPISKVFVPTNTNVIKMSADYIKIMALSFGFFGIQLVISGIFRGAGLTLSSMFVAILFFWFLRLPLAFYLTSLNNFKETGIWWSFPIANVGAAIIVMIWFLNGKWANKNLTKE